MVKYIAIAYSPNLEFSDKLVMGGAGSLSIQVRRQQRSGW